MVRHENSKYTYARIWSPVFVLMWISDELSSLRTKNHQSFPARRLWHFLVKQETLQETLIRYIFTKKRKQSEVSSPQTRRRNCMVSLASLQEQQLAFSFIFTFAVVAPFITVVDIYYCHYHCLDYFGNLQSSTGHFGAFSNVWKYSLWPTEATVAANCSKHMLDYSSWIHLSWYTASPVGPRCCNSMGCFWLQYVQVISKLHRISCQHFSFSFHSIFYFSLFVHVCAVCFSCILPVLCCVV